jgi:Zn-dependent protease with chaperone function
MEQLQLNSLITRLENFAKVHPTAYRIRVGLLAGLGYAYLLLVVLLLLLLVFLTLNYVRFNALTLKLAWIPLVVAGGVLRALWVTIPEPDGKELQHADAPRLFDLVLEVQQALDGPRVHHILVSDEMNAGIVQVPRLGMFGWLTNYLVVGLPLLKSLSPDEFRSVLAHEFGHLSGKHGKFSAWIYRARESWTEILARVHADNRFASFMFEPFLKWYAPFLNAYSFVLARAQEYEADEFSAELAGKEVTARTLMRLSTKDSLLSNEFWPKFFHQAASESLPPRDPFSQMLAATELSVDHHRGTKWVLQALKVETGYEDTHPALADRLVALGYEPQDLSTDLISNQLAQSDELGINAAQAYLNGLPNDFIQGFDRLWKERISAEWTEHFKRCVEAGRRIEELDFASRARALTVDELWERASLINLRQGPEAAAPHFRHILELDPDHPEANLALGFALLEQKDEAGVSHLDKAISLKETLAVDACGIAYDYFLERGDIELADRYHHQGQLFAEKVQRFYEQATNVTVDDRFKAHGLLESEVDDLRGQLLAIHGLGRTYLVRKVVDPEIEPVYVVAAFATFTWRDGTNDKHVESLIDELATTLRFPSLLICISMDVHRFLSGKFEEIEGAVIIEGGDENIELRR